MQEVLIDTDILSYFLSGDKNVSEKIQEYLVYNTKLTFSQITYYEILAGLEHKQAKRQIQDFERFALKCSILKLTNNSIKQAAKIYGELRREGIQIGTPDLLIAGTAIENNLILVTNNLKHYQRIKELATKSWKE